MCVHLDVSKPQSLSSDFPIQGYSQNQIHMNSEYQTSALDLSIKNDLVSSFHQNETDNEEQTTAIDLSIKKTNILKSSSSLNEITHR